MKKSHKKRTVKSKSTRMLKMATTKLSHAMPPEVSKMFGQIQGAAEDWMAFASQQRTRLVREVRGMCEEILEKISESPVFAHRDELVREMRAHLESMVNRLNAGTLLDRAIDSAKMRQHELLSFLNVPSQQELKQLQRKLNLIETRLNTIRRTKKGAAQSMSSAR